MSWRPIATAPKAREVLIRFPSGAVDVAYQTNNGPPFMETWRYGGTAKRGEQAPWPIEWCEIPTDPATAIADTVSGPGDKQP